MRHVLLSLALLVGLAGCGGKTVWAPDDVVQRALYKHNGPPSLMLITVISNSSNGGAHSALLVNGSQRVIFDPAGTWRHPYSPERNDVRYGITPQVLEHYIDYHARTTYRVIKQELPVSAELAELALQEAQAYGAVGNGYCSNSVTGILRKLPGFQSVSRTFFPNAVMRDFARLPGVRTERIFDDSPDDNKDVLIRTEAALLAARGG